MELIDIPTEQTTAATDGLVVIIAAVFAVMLSKEGTRSDRMGMGATFTNASLLAWVPHMNTTFTMTQLLIPHLGLGQQIDT